jgi:hypothetical protein
MTTTKLVLGGDETPAEITTPFLPVYVAFRDVLTGSERVTVEHVIEAVVSVALTAAINMKIQFRDDPNCPSVEGLVRVLCVHMMGAAKDAERELAEQTGAGATRQ